MAPISRYGITIGGKYHELDCGEAFELLRTINWFVNYVDIDNAPRGSAWHPMSQRMLKLLEEFPGEDY